MNLPSIEGNRGPVAQREQMRRRDGDIPSIFPLRLSAFEDYLLADDRVDYPLNIYLRLRFSGDFERDRFETALRTTLARHPLLGARVIRASNGSAQWIAGEEAADLSWLEKTEAWPHRAAFDLAREPPLRTAVRPLSDDRTEVLFEVHHVACDGIGMLRFTEDLLQAYAQSDCGSAGIESSYRPDKLAMRDKFTGARRSLAARAVTEILSWAAIIRCLLYFPAPLKMRDHDPILMPHPFPPHCVGELTNTESRSLLAAARQMNLTLNDLLISDAFEVMQNRNTEAGGRPGLPLRIVMPINMRGPEHAGLPAANIMSFALLDRRGRVVRQRDRLRRSVGFETRLIKRFALGSIVVRGLRLARSFPALRRWFLERDMCLGSMVLSNLGTVLDTIALPKRDGRVLLGKLELESLDIAPPVRPLTRVSVIVLRYAGRLTLTMRYDAKSVSPAGAQALHAALLDKWRATASALGEAG